MPGSNTCTCTYTILNFQTHFCHHTHTMLKAGCPGNTNRKKQIKNENFFLQDPPSSNDPRGRERFSKSSHPPGGFEVCFHFPGSYTLWWNPVSRCPFVVCLPLKIPASASGIRIPNCDLNPPSRSGPTISFSSFSFPFGEEIRVESSFFLPSWRDSIYLQILLGVPRIFSSCSFPFPSFISKLHVNIYSFL